MNIYHWIAIILAADILLILFVRGADERRSTRERKSNQWRTQP
jgi:hypothetical protein